MQCKFYNDGPILGSYIETQRKTWLVVQSGTEEVAARLGTLFNVHFIGGKGFRIKALL